MNRAEFRERIRGVLGDAEPTGNPRFSDELLNLWLDDELTEIQAEMPWAYTRRRLDIVGTSGETDYVLGDDVLRIDYVTDDAGREVAFDDEFAQRGGSGPGYSIPMADPVTLRLTSAPTSDRALVVHAFVRFMGLSDDTTDVVLPPEFSDIVVFRVASKCAMRDRMLPMAGAFAQEAETLQRKVAHTQRGLRTSELHTMKLLRPAGP